MNEAHRNNWYNLFQDRLDPLPDGKSPTQAAASFRSLLLPEKVLFQPDCDVPVGFVVGWHEYTLQEGLLKTQGWGQRSLLWRLQLVAWLAEAMDALHQRHVLHCDVKPENILLTRPADRIRAFETEPGLCLTDFSSSLRCKPDSNLRHNSPPKWSDQTPSHDINYYLGTRDRFLDWRTDVYALGLVGWQILLGQAWNRDGDDSSPKALLQKIEAKCRDFKQDGGQEAFFWPLYSCIGGIEPERSNWMLTDVYSEDSMAERMKASSVGHASLHLLLQESKFYNF